MDGSSAATKVVEQPVCNVLSCGRMKGSIIM